MRSALFDLDGTLLDTAPDFYRVIAELAERHNLPTPNYQIIRDNASNGGHAMLTGVFGDTYLKNKDTLHDEFLNHYRQTPVKTGTLFPGVNDALLWLEEQAIPWGIVTNKPRDLTERVLTSLNLTERCRTLICPEDVTTAKPDPEGILTAIKNTHARAEHSLYFGDHHRDILAGQAACVPTVACEFGYVTADDNIDLWNADHRVTHSTDLRSFLIHYFD